MLEKNGKRNRKHCFQFLRVCGSNSSDGRLLDFYTVVMEYVICSDVSEEHWNRTSILLSVKPQKVTNTGTFVLFIQVTGLFPTW